MTTRYMNPYLAGVLLGLLLLVTIFVTGRGLGASGAYRSTLTAAVTSLAPSHAAGNPFYDHPEPGSPLKSWLVFEIVGVLIGGFLSGVASDRLAAFVERPPHVTARRRLIAAFAGGALFGVGAQFGRGCTSGAALSGMAVMSLGGIVTMMAIFGSAYGVAYFFRRLWIPGAEASHGPARS
jgi:uncharacterized membrane protein YedE/YeeE